MSEPWRVFAFGSLIGAPELPDAVIARYPAVLSGHRRAFNKISSSRSCTIAFAIGNTRGLPTEFDIAGRRPRRRSLVLGTEVDDRGCIEGVVIEYGAERAAEALALTDQREGYRVDAPCDANGYLRQAVEVACIGQQLSLRCDAYLSNTADGCRLRKPHLSLTVQAQVLINATPRARRPARDEGFYYLEGVRSALAAEGIVDPYLEQLAAEVRRLVGPSWQAEIADPRLEFATD